MSLNAGIELPICFRKWTYFSVLNFKARPILKRLEKYWCADTCFPQNAFSLYAPSLNWAKDSKLALSSMLWSLKMHVIMPASTPLLNQLIAIVTFDGHFKSSSVPLSSAHM